MPGDTSRHELGRPLIMFAVIRAVAIGGAVAIAFGLDLAHGYWLPIAAITAAVLTLMDLPQPPTTVPRATGCCGRCAAWRSACS
jgi:uncharacterized membrane protein YccC